MRFAIFLAVALSLITPTAVAQTAPSTSAYPTSHTLSQQDLNQISSAVLTDERVAMYLHPEAPGRLPVTIALASPYSEHQLDLVLYGKPVKVVTKAKQAANAVNLAFEPNNDTCVVRVAYRPEGIFGTVKLARTQGEWKVVDATILE